MQLDLLLKPTLIIMLDQASLISALSLLLQILQTMQVLLKLLEVQQSATWMLTRMLLQTPSQTLVEQVSLQLI